MGRLTLNVLLSFAQFEREVTGERIRDKIAASKRKGMWMGGFVPLGYDVRERRVVINEVGVVRLPSLHHLVSQFQHIGENRARVARVRSLRLASGSSERSS
jgi:site-specific DNA recombinase